MVVVTRIQRHQLQLASGAKGRRSWVAPPRLSGASARHWFFPSLCPPKMGVTPMLLWVRALLPPASAAGFPCVLESREVGSIVVGARRALVTGCVEELVSAGHQEAGSAWGILPSAQWPRVVSLLVDQVDALDGGVPEDACEECQARRPAACMHMLHIRAACLVCQTRGEVPLLRTSRHACRHVAGVGLAGCAG